MELQNSNMNNLDTRYQALLQDILDNGVEKKDRTGTGTLSVFGRQIRHKMSEGFPLLTTKEMAWKTMVTELLWFLRGDTNIKYLVDNGCHIWDGDAYKNWCRQFEVDPNNFDSEELVKGHGDQCWGYPLLENTSKEYKRGQINAYLEGKAEKPFFYLTQEEFINEIKTNDEFAQEWGELGPIYGKQWRSWYNDNFYKHITSYDRKTNDTKIEHKVNYIDQIQNLINDLKTNPDSRRLMVNAWNVGELDQMVLPPCHYGFQVYTRELSLVEMIRLAKYENEEEIIKSRKENITQISERLLKDNIPTRAISLMFNMRSTDVGLGLGFNLASYGLLLMMIAKQVNMVPDELIYNGGDVHLYKNHIEPIKEQLNREPYPLPIVKLSDRVVNDIADYTLDDIVLENYKSHPTIKMPLSN
jgi:thymidylate synthase